MKRILNHTRHLLRAKGRHGTHSPFVYAFVEQVMRTNRDQPFQAGSASGFSSRETVLLAATFRFLDKKTIYAEPCLYDLCRSLNSGPGGAAVKQLEPGIMIAEDDAVVFCTATETMAAYLKTISAMRTLTAIVPRIHRGVVSESCWRELTGTDTFRMAIDTWYFGLLSNHPDFKMKQFFRIR